MTPLIPLSSLKRVTAVKTVVFLALLTLSTFSMAQTAPSDQKPASSPTDAEMADRVRQEFVHAWEGYKKYAWGHDELKPLSKSYHDWYAGSLMMTPIDALDTMLVMGLKQQADETRALIDTELSFDQDIYVKNFEITIRLLGGLLSSYQLSGDKHLLELAQDLGNRLLPAFESPTGLPYVEVNLKTGKVRNPHTNPAEVGTLLIEFGTLSKLTGKPIYYDKAKRAVVEMYKRRSKIGLVGSGINVETGDWTGTTADVGGGLDSYYEYLLKSWLLFGDKDCKQMWDETVAALNKYSAEDTATGLWYGQFDMYTGKRTGHNFGALDAFFPGTLALSGDLDRARRLEESAYKMWNLYGLEPVEINYEKMTIVANGYELQPEIIESAYYLRHFTHDPRYREMGLTFFDNIVKYCRTDVAYAAVSDVQTKKQADIMQSYFLAETMKYLFLVFSPDKIDLNNHVFNTEAHSIERTW
jgi:ER degradation enhancer, mannosidase alpha-like 2